MNYHPYIMKTTIRTRPIDIGEVIQNGVVFDFKNWQREDVIMQGLPEAVARLLTTLEERRIEHVLVGGIAMLQYVEGRNTQDLDLIVDPEALAKLPEVEVTSRQEDFARGTFAGLRVDFLFTTHRLFQIVRDKYSTIRPFQQGRIRCATVEGMLLLKLYALPSLYRQEKFERVALYEGDISMLMQVGRPAIEPLVGELKPHVSASDLSEVRKITDEIRQRIERFERKRKEKE